MKRLRHPIRAIREPFGTAGLIVAMIALVAALGGTALAAKGALTGKQKKEVTKIAQTEAKKYAGKPGAAGATGPAGPAGPAGAAGAKGDNGTNGTNGTNGAPGESVSAASYTGSECHGEGHKGSKFTVGASTTYACNGAAGAPGAIQPGATPGEANPLPSEATETGTWAISGATLGEKLVIPISFTVPLAAPLTGGEYENANGEYPCGFDPVGAECQTHWINKAGKEVNEAGQEIANPSACPGTAADPKAEPGNLCVYAVAESNVTANDGVFYTSGVYIGNGASTSGSIIRTFVVGGPEGYAYGTWAVTAP